MNALTIRYIAFNIGTEKRVIIKYFRTKVAATYRPTALSRPPKSQDTAAPGKMNRQGSPSGADHQCRNKLATFQLTANWAITPGADDCSTPVKAAFLQAVGSLIKFNKQTIKTHLDHGSFIDNGE